MQPEKLHDIFMSCAGSDLQRVSALIDALQSEGISVYVESESERDEDARKPHVNELRNSQVLLLVWSAATQKSSLVGQELKHARRLNIPIVIVAVDAHPLYHTLVGEPFVDLQGWNGKRDHGNWQQLQYHLQSRHVLDELSDLQTSRERRIAIGKILADIGDPRPGVGVDQHGFPAIEWVKISEGETTVGDSEPISLACFQISKYPITQQQFNAFVKGGGYYRSSDTDKTKYPFGRYYNAPEQLEVMHPNYPRTRISWFEAMAFCSWLSLPDNGEITLPTEEQWIRAACSDSGSVYPWGDRWLPDQANFTHGELLTPVPETAAMAAVGLFIADKSRFGVMDMGGNVHDWCLTPQDHDEYLYKGGAFDTPHWNALVCSRRSANPFLRSDTIGFRIVRTTTVANQ